MAKKAKLTGQFKDQRGQGVTQYHPWATTQMSNAQGTREEWVKRIISYIEEKGSKNPSQKRLASYLKDKTACHIIGFAPYIEYIKHKPEGGMDLSACYLHAFGNPCLLVFDKKSQSLLIVGPEIDFNPDNGIRG